MALPSGIDVVRADGMTVVPGPDMHTHVTQVEWAPVHLAAGVTTVRDMGNEFEFITAPAARSRPAGSGPADAGGGSHRRARAHRVRCLRGGNARTEGRRLVSRYHRAGFEQIKLYSLLTPPVVEAICAEAITGWA
ncbi:MAG: hypothetical protein R2712_09100 [Vicinamibacterales bacterium]